jgi:cytochrome oxidase Cu insertion factor (SCO1/SenC/PrrC family)
MQASTLALARRRFGSNAISVSITIDPEYDTPVRLKAYGSNFGVDSKWFLLTGRRGDILKVLSAFEARPFGDNKMLHRPLVFFRPAKGRQWVRLEGLMNADQIASAYSNAASNPPPKSSTVGSLHETLNKLIG